MTKRKSNKNADKMFSSRILIFIVVILFFLLLLWLIKSQCGGENFGQDPSIRSQSGWVAGSGMYGYDPINHFAEQISAMNKGDYSKMVKPPMAKNNEFCSANGSNLISGPNNNVGPIETYRENHGPYNRKCVHNPDCWEGETCYLGTCIPADLEPYKYDQEPQPSCKSCMSTEDFKKESSY